MSIHLVPPSAFGACRVLRAGMDDFLAEDRARLLVPRMAREPSLVDEGSTRGEVTKYSTTTSSPDVRQAALASPDVVDISDAGWRLAASAGRGAAERMAASSDRATPTEWPGHRDGDRLGR